jgi:hypothetical protein
VRHGDAFYGGTVTGWIDGKYWVSFYVDDEHFKKKVTEDMLRAR